MKYKKLEELTEDELIQEFEIRFASAYELEEALRVFPRREAELTRKAMKANKSFNKFTILMKITEANLIKKIREKSEKEGKPIAPSAIGEIRKSMVAAEDEWADVSKKLNEKRAESEFWSGLLNAWHSRGFRLQELAKITEHTLWREPVVYNTQQEDTKVQFRQTAEDAVEDKMESQNNLELD